MFEGQKEGKVNFLNEALALSVLTKLIMTLFHKPARVWVRFTSLESRFLLGVQNLLTSDCREFQECRQTVDWWVPVKWVFEKASQVCMIFSVQLLITFC